MNVDGAYALALVGALNTAWFTAAFRFFGFQQQNAAKVLVMRHQREGPLYPSMAAIVRFIGGFNGALALLSGILTISWLLDTDQFAGRGEQVVLLGVLGMANLSQFAFNVPVLRKHTNDKDALWPVTTGPMRRIFAIDLLLAVIDFIAVAIVAGS